MLYFRMCTVLSLRTEGEDWTFLFSTSLLTRSVTVFFSLSEQAGHTSETSNFIFHSTVHAQKYSIVYKTNGYSWSKITDKFIK
jgi:hypothetical protein